ncbi:hypothetical protein PGQ11_002871 [Apiospora arundinis]|uniref:Uncharacterized protein n=1 Tax=Apiospora arundinis TaxID=335852 RepID=A0ABR2J3Z4_9PEZI
MAAANYDRWLKNATPWAQEDDWDMDEYFKWVKRLSDAKSQLDETYLSVDKSLLDVATKMAVAQRKQLQENKQLGHWPQITEGTVGKLAVRYIIAYHFFVRATYEEIPDNALVGRVQQEFAQLEIGLLDVDVAHMLQLAADKVPLETAVKTKLAEFAKKFKESAPVVDQCNRWDFSLARMALIVKRLPAIRQRQDQKNPPTLTAEYTTMWNECRPEYAAMYGDEDNPFALPATEAKLKEVVAALSTRAKLDLYLARRAEPQLQGTRRDNDEFAALERMMEPGGDIDSLLAKAKDWERKKCSWEATIGPAVKALRRLGRGSSGHDFAELAKYAQAHAKPVSVIA